MFQIVAFLAQNILKIGLAAVCLKPPNEQYLTVFSSKLTHVPALQSQRRSPDHHPAIL